MGLEADATMVERTFGAEHGRGPGDYKIDFTGSVRSEGIGHGSALPRLMLPDQITRIDQLLAELDYPTIEAARRGDLGALLGLQRKPPEDLDGHVGEVTRRLVEVLSAGLDATRSDPMVRRSLEIRLVRAARCRAPPVGRLRTGDCPRGAIGGWRGRAAVAEAVGHGRHLAGGGRRVDQSGPGVPRWRRAGGAAGGEGVRSAIRSTRRDAGIACPAHLRRPRDIGPGHLAHGESDVECRFSRVPSCLIREVRAGGATWRYVAEWPSTATFLDGSCRAISR